MSNGTEEQIRRQREDFARARSDIAKAKEKTPEITERLLRQGSTQPLMGRLQRRQILEQKEKLKLAEEEVQGKQLAFETEVAMKAPQYADPVIKRQLAEQAEQKIQRELENLSKEYSKADTSEERNKLLKKINVYKQVLKLESGQLIQAVESGKIEKVAKRISLTDPKFTSTYTTTEEISGYSYTSPSGIKYFTDPSGKLQGVEDIYKGESRNPNQSDQLVFENLKRQAPVSSYIPIDKPSWETPITRFSYEVTEVAKKILPEGSRKLLGPSGLGTVYSETGKPVGVTRQQYETGIKTVTVPLYAQPQRYIDNNLLSSQSIIPTGKVKIQETEMLTFSPDKLISKRDTGQPTFKIDSQSLMLESSVFGLPTAFGGQAVKTPTYVRDFFFDKEIVDIPIKVRAVPQTETFIISDPKLKMEFLKTSPELVQLEEKGVSLVVSKTKTGEALVRIERPTGKPQKSKFLSYTPEREVINVGLTRAEEGLFKTLRGRQAQSVAKTFQEGVFGREFSSMVSKGAGKNLRVTSESFISGSQMMGSQFGTGRVGTFRGLGKVKTRLIIPKKPVIRTQRTGKISGFVEELSTGEFKINDIKTVPVTTGEGIIRFESLFRNEPVAAERLRSIAIGVEPESKVLLRARNLVPRVTRQDRSFDIFKDFTKNAEQISEQQMQNIVKQASQRVPTPKLKIEEITPNIVNVRVSPMVPYEQLGVYDVTESTGVADFRKIADNFKYTERQRFNLKENTLQDELQELQTLSKSNLKLSSASLTNIKQGERQMEKQQQKLLLRTLQEQNQIEKQIQRSTTTTRPATDRGMQRFPPRVPLFKFPTGKNIPSPFKNIEKDYSKAYNLFIKRFGKYRPAGEFTRGKALMEGERITRKTLAASFKIVPTNRLLKGKDVNYNVSNIFRTYKIEKGRRVPLLNEFIQKRGTRLGSRDEVSEILGFKRKKSKRRKR